MVSCQICTKDDLRKSNYGVEACRNCAAFFRRTIKENLTYQCRNSKNCDLKNGSRCQACRLKLCYKIGMHPNDLRSQKIEHTKKEDQKYPILEKLQQGIRNFHDAQKAAILAEKPEIGSLKANEYVLNTKHVFDHNDSLSYPLVESMLYEFYEPYRLLETKEKEILSSNFIPRFLLVDRIFLTSKTFPDPEDGRMLTHYKHVLDVKAKRLLQKDSPEQKFNQANELCYKVASHCRDMVVKLVDKDTCEIEITALVYFLFANECENFPSLKEKVTYQMNQIFEEMYAYYLEKFGLQQVAVKYGSLFTTFNEFMTLFHTIHEEYVVANVFSQGYYSDTCIELEKSFSKIKISFNNGQERKSPEDDEVSQEEI